MKITILGCGSSGGVPRIGNDWGACDPTEPRNKRSRCSILVEEGASSVLVDTSPDLRWQLIDAGVSRLDGVIYTHEHADQTNGIDDIRAVVLRMRKRIDIYADSRTMGVLSRRFDYIFEQPPDSSYPPLAIGHTISLDDGPLVIGDVAAQPFLQHHGDIDSLGLRFGSIGYSNDVHELPEAAFEVLAGVDVWIVDALRYKPHPTHAHLDRALAWIERLGPRRAILTNMHIDMDYQTLRRELPEGVEPAYDGMVIEAAAP